jgi:mannosyltransferase
VLVPTADVDALVAALEPLMRDPERVAAMGHRARTHVVENFSSESEADRIVAVYRQVWATAETKD